MEDKALKCPKCKTIQFKGQYCTSDGSKLQVCSLEEENRLSSDEIYHLNILIQAENGNNNLNINQTNSATSKINDYDDMNYQSHLIEDLNENEVEEIKQLIDEMLEEIDVNEIKAELGGMSKEFQTSQNEPNTTYTIENGSQKRPHKRDNMTNDDDDVIEIIEENLSENENSQNVSMSNSYSLAKQKKKIDAKKTHHKINVKKIVEIFNRSSLPRLNIFFLLKYNTNFYFLFYKK